MTSTTVPRATGYCPRCAEWRLLLRERPNHILHLLLSVLTVGLWLVVWLVVTARSQAASARCSVCGTQFRKTFVPGVGTKWTGCLVVLCGALTLAPAAMADQPVQIRDGKASTLIRIVAKPGQTVEAISPALSSINRIDPQANGRSMYYDSNGRVAYAYGQGFVVRMSSHGHRLKITAMNASQRTGTVGIRLWTTRQIRYRQLRLRDHKSTRHSE